MRRLTNRATEGLKLVRGITGPYRWLAAGIVISSILSSSLDGVSIGMLVPILRSFQKGDAGHPAWVVGRPAAAPGPDPRPVARPEILILDEATSALDEACEEKVLQGLRSFARGRTIIVIAHRRSTLAVADQVVSIEQGRAVAGGMSLPAGAG